MAMPRQQLSLEQFLRLPEEEPAIEFDDGRITQKVSPKGRHSCLQAMISDLINRFGKGKKLALAFPELRTTFGGRSYVPDVAVYRWDRIPTTAKGEVADDFLAPPDLVVEIASPEQSITALLRRCLWYVANGVPLALLVDPADGSVVMFHPNRLPLALRDSDLIDLTDMLPGFDLRVQTLFDALKLR